MRSVRGQFGLGWVLAICGLGLLSGGCSGNEGDSPNDEHAGSGVVSELRSNAPRVTPDATEGKTAAQGEQAFGVAFLHALDPNENTAFSPHSLSTAFAMLTDAAEGQTLAEVEQALSFGTTDEAFHRSQGALQLGLRARNREALQTADHTVDAQILTESNDIWLRDDVPPTPSYLDTLARYYGVGVHRADFANKPEEARVAINAKVSNDTHSLISELIPKRSINDKTVAVLTNALYFKAPWATPLGKPAAGQFQKLDGSTSEVQMMRTGGQLRYYPGNAFVSVALPYYGSELELQLIVPDVGAYETVRSALSSDVLSQTVTAGTFEQVDLTLPKFDVKSVVPAKDVLKSLGVVTAFDKEAASFPAFASPVFDNVYVSDVLHQATVAIDEKGTEASAATAIVLSGVTSSIEPEPITPKVIVADRPFLFVIRDNPTGALLFVGQVVAP
ncbi:MAG TPA: serpin family protein [Polyangiaceae bacterium]|nr:serpin family protein [Polyangiaceae bacterium]